jgi:hypothetical protein
MASPLEQRQLAFTPHAQHARSFSLAKLAYRLPPDPYRDALSRQPQDRRPKMADLDLIGMIER